MASLPLILIVFAFVLFALAIWPLAPARFNLIAAGLACYMLSLLVTGLHSL